MIENAIDEFYKLKSNYENEIIKNKKSIINNSSLSWKEKRIEFQKLKPKCINCKRPGGTVFSVKYDTSNNYRQLRAFCGIIANPCNLNIVINLGNYYSLLYIIEDTEKDIQEIKNNIINDKNKVLFGCITSEVALNKFNEVKEQLKDLTDILESYLSEYNNIVDNKERNTKIYTNIEASELLILDIKKVIKDFDNTGNVQYINDVIDIYSLKLKPLLNDLMNLKYKENMVWFDENENTYNLIQNTNTISDLEINLGNDLVKSFEVGLKEVPKRKQKRNNELEEEETIKLRKEINKLEEEPKQNELLNLNEPIINLEDGTVSWNSDKYQQIWNNTNPKMQQALLQDTEWLQNFMNSCVNSKENRQPCKFISPSNLILPPQILENNEYDFGNEVYNNIFNKLDKSYQNTLLTLYSNKNGIKNYKMLEDALGNIVAKELNFNKYV